MAVADKDALLGAEADFPTDEFETPQGTIRIRGLSAAEVHKFSTEKNSVKVDRMVVSMAAVEPRLTEDEAGTLQRRWPAGRWVELTQTIRRLSGLDEGASKSGVPSVRAEPDE